LRSILIKINYVENKVKIKREERLEERRKMRQPVEILKGEITKREDDENNKERKRR